MDISKEVGVVVVGLGIAGKIRVRDLKTRSCSLLLKGVVSRRKSDIENVTQISFEEALDGTDIKAIIISTEPALHEEYVRRALDKGKHVLVEYPVARTASAARQLFQLAEEKGLILYEENIALFQDSHLAVKEKAGTVDIKRATYSLSGSYNGWLEDFEGSGLPFISGVSGLQVMLSVFGDLGVKGGKMERTEDGYTAQASLETHNGRPITISLSRSSSKETRRARQLVYEFDDGQSLDTSKIPQKVSSPGLFMQDMEAFDAIIGKGKLPEDSKWLSIRSLELAEQIHSFF